ncbi:MAG: metalloregulator ArsR/SmtB family transcription factor [Nitriliruptoraceae bacterium]
MPDVTTERADDVFGALADATRRDILARTMGRELAVSELAACYPMSFAAVQKHVAVLERAGLVRKRADGRRRVVTTDMDGLRRAQVVLDHFESLWRGRVERMHGLIDEERSASAIAAPNRQEHV